MDYISLAIFLIAALAGASIGFVLGYEKCKHHMEKHNMQLMQRIIELTNALNKSK